MATAYARTITLLYIYLCVWGLDLRLNNVNYSYWYFPLSIIITSLYWTSETLLSSSIITSEYLICDILEIWLRLRKSTQRCSEPSFFLTNKTGALCGDEIGQIKSVLRFSSMNSFRASCSDAEREYIGLTRGWAPSSRLILSGNYRVWWLQRGVQKEQRCQWCVGHDVRKSEIFLQRWTEVYWLIYPVNQ